MHDEIELQLIPRCVYYAYHIQLNEEWKVALGIKSRASMV